MKNTCAKCDQNQPGNQKNIYYENTFSCLLTIELWPQVDFIKNLIGQTSKSVYLHQMIHIWTFEIHPKIMSPCNHKKFQDLWPSADLIQNLV